MDWGQFLILILAIGALFWSQKADIIANRTESAADRRDMLQLLRAIQDEMKEFHDRLCDIERKRN